MSEVDLSPICLYDSSGDLIAKAFYKKKPSKRCPDPYWKMRFQDKKEFLNLGRMSRDKVLIRMKEIVAKETVEKGSVEYLLRGFFNYKLESGDWKSEKTWVGVDNDIGRILPILGQEMLLVLKQTHIDNLVEFLKRKYAKRTINKTLGTLSSAVIWGRKMGLDIPYLNFKRLKVKKDEYENNHYTPTEEEVDQVFEAIEDDTLKRTFFILEKTGARLSEVLNLSHENTQYIAKKGLYRLKLDGKTGDRLSFLTPEEFEILKDFLLCKRDYFFSQQDLNNIATKIKRVCRKVGVEEFTPHGLRRAMANKLYGKVSPREYVKLMGHSVETFWRCYYDMSEEDLMDAFLSFKSLTSTKHLKEVA